MFKYIEMFLGFLTRLLHRSIITQYSFSCQVMSINVFREYSVNVSCFSICFQIEQI